MSIKSLFVPPYAIQGEEIPAFVLWEALKHQFIKIELPEAMRLKELYNVEEDMFETSKKTVTVKQVVIDGYLGMLLETRKLKEYSAEVQVKFSFLKKDGEKIIEESKIVNLFRPQLEIVDTPEIIKVDVEKNYVHGRIVLRKLGKGTLVIAFRTPKESELQKITPESVQEFLKNVERDLEINFENLKKSFPKYSNELDRYRYYIAWGWNNYEELRELKKISKNLLEASIENETFAELLLKAIAKSITENIKILTAPESFLKYIESILSEKVWVPYPWETIRVSKEPKTLLLEIVPTDLLFDEYEFLRFKPIKVHATCDGDIEITRLITWRK
jgi:hypothetical protein